MFISIFCSSDIQQEINFSKFQQDFNNQNFIETEHFLDFVNNKSKINLNESQIYIEDRLIFDHQLLNLLVNTYISEKKDQDVSSLDDDGKKEIFFQTVEKCKNDISYKDRLTNHNFLKNIDDNFINIFINQIINQANKSQIFYSLVNENKRKVMFLKILFYNSKDIKLELIFKLNNEKKYYKTCNLQIEESAIVDVQDQNHHHYSAILDSKNSKEFIINLFKERKTAEDFIKIQSKDTNKPKFGRVHFEVNKFRIYIKIGTANLILNNQKFLTLYRFVQKYLLLILGGTFCSFGVYYFFKNNKTNKPKNKKEIMRQAIEEIV